MAKKQNHSAAAAQNNDASPGLEKSGSFEAAESRAPEGVVTIAVQTYVVQWDLQRNGHRYVEGDEITLTNDEAATIGDCIRLK